MTQTTTIGQLNAGTPATTDKVEVETVGGASERRTVAEILGLAPPPDISGAATQVAVFGADNALAGAGLTYTATPAGDEATAAIVFSATNSEASKWQASVGIQMALNPTGDTINGDYVISTGNTLGPLQPRVVVKGAGEYLEVLTGSIINPSGNMTLEAGEGGSAILRSDTLGPITHSNEINVSGIGDEIDITFLSAGVGGLYITPTQLMPADDGLQSLGGPTYRWLSVRCKPVALATLGSAATAGAGTRAMISDGLNMGTWGATAVDGGSTVKPVFSNGTNWLNG